MCPSIISFSLFFPRKDFAKLRISENKTKNVFEFSRLEGTSTKIIITERHAKNKLVEDSHAKAVDFVCKLKAMFCDLLQKKEKTIR